MLIGEVAKRAGVTASTVRYYERASILPKPRRKNGIRQYDDDVLKRLSMIRLAQSAGLTLKETRTLLRAMEQKGNAVMELQRLAIKKLPELQTALERARTLVELMTAAQSCGCPEPRSLRGDGPAARAPVIAEHRATPDRPSTARAHATFRGE